MHPRADVCIGSNLHACIQELMCALVAVHMILWLLSQKCISIGCIIAYIRKDAIATQIKFSIMCNVCGHKERSLSLPLPSGQGMVSSNTIMSYNSHTENFLDPHLEISFVHMTFIVCWCKNCVPLKKKRNL